MRDPTRRRFLGTTGAALGATALGGPGLAAEQAPARPKVAVLASAYGIGVGITGLVLTMATVAVVLAAAVYLVTLFWPMMSVIFDLDDVQSALASVSRMVGVITSIDPASSPGTETPADASIRLEQVSHAYGEDADGAERIVLRPIDLDIAAGKTVALTLPKGVELIEEPLGI